jgi:phosphate/phosphite/phosphonate ABC transporter binding protein
LATYRYADNDRIKNIAPLGIHLTENLGIQVKVKSYPSVHQFIEAIQNNEVDIALINTFGYLLLENSKPNYPMFPSLVLKIREDAKDNYKTALVSNKKSEIRTLSDVKRMADQLDLLLVSPGSTSGNLVPRLILNSIAIESPESVFKSVSYGETHKSTIEAIAEGKKDLGALGSNEFFNSQKDPNLTSKLHLVHLSSEIPLGPVLLNKDLNKDQAEVIQKLFLDLHLTNPKAFESVKAGWSEAAQTEKYTSIDEHYYKSFKKESGKKSGMKKILTQFSN